MQSSDANYTVPPFPSFPSVSRYVPVGSVEETLNRLCRSIDARETISVVIGPPGTGKSLICNLLADRYRDRCDVVGLGEARIDSPQSLLSHLLHQLRLIQPGSPAAHADKDSLQWMLKDYLCSDQCAGGGLLLLIDEAQSLSADALEAIRMVTNIMHQGQPKVSAVFAGGVKLEEQLIDPALEAFQQRVTTRCYLHPLHADETRQYVNATIEACGSNPHETITDQAIMAVHHACNGVPRLINQMLTQAIDCAEEADQNLIDEAIIDRAWSVLQQLPSPMIDQPNIASQGSPIEFGELREATFEPETGRDFVEDTDSHAEAHSIAIDIESHDISSIDSNVVTDEDLQSLLNGPAATVGLEAEDELNHLTFESETPQAEVHNKPPVIETTVEPPVATAEELFGEFEEEEEIALTSDATASPQLDDEEKSCGGSCGAGPCQSLRLVAPDENDFSNDIEIIGNTEVNEGLSIGTDIAFGGDLEIRSDALVEVEPLESTAVRNDAASANREMEHESPVAETELEDSLHEQIVGLSDLAKLAHCGDGAAIAAIQAEGFDLTSEAFRSELIGPIADEQMAIADELFTAASDIESSDVKSGDVSETESDHTPSPPATDDDIAIVDSLDVEVIKEPSIVLNTDVENQAAWIDESDSEDQSEDIQLRRDDSDMLVIEDEVEVRRIDPAAQRDSRNKTISVDFQKMLSRMRRTS